MHFPYRCETKELDSSSRVLASGRFVRLSAGLTHYELSGSDSGKPVVLLHGMAGPLGIWHKVAESLTARGFKVLQFDLYGRGYSDRPSVDYDTDLFLTQLQELMLELLIDPPVILVGWSLGGMISATYAAKFQSELERLVLIAPAGIQVSLPTISRIGMVPILGEFLMSLMGRRIVLNSLIRGLHRRDLQTDYLDLISEQMQYRGYLRAFLSTLRNCAYKDISREYKIIGTLQLPVLMISGSEDQSIPLSARRKITELIPNLVYHEIRDAGHILQIEKPKELNSLLCDFISSGT